MTRSNVLATLTLAALSLWSTSRARADSLQACGGIYLKADASCEFRPTKECMTECMTVAVETSCVAQIHGQCEGSCTATASASCETRCTEVCMDDCDDDDSVVPSCTELCEADCGATCAERCEGKGHCGACCSHSCRAKCDSRCAEEAPVKECEPTCATACTASCTAQANTQCQFDCQTDIYLACEQEMVEKCETDCKTTGGAIFCDGQFLATEDLDDCAAELAAEIDIEVDVKGEIEGSVDIDTNNNSAGKSGSDDDDDDSLNCSVVEPGTMRGGSGTWAGLLCAFGLAGVLYRRRVYTRALTLIAALGFGICTGAACNRTPDEARADGLRAQHEAIVEIRENDQEARSLVKETEAEAARDVAETNAAAQKAAMETTKKVDEAYQKNRADNAATQAKANETIREANRERSESENELHQWAQGKLDDLDNTLDGARAKAEKAVPKARANFASAMRSVETKRDAIAAEVASLKTQTASKADVFKTHLEAEVTRLKQRVETLSRTL
jgi:hypothetical protein